MPMARSHPPMRRPIYITSRAHYTARGHGEDAARAVLADETASAQRQISGALEHPTLPYFRLPLSIPAPGASPWQARAQAAVTQCARALAEQGAARGLPVFVASSSFQAGRLEERFLPGAASPDPSLAGTAAPNDVSELALTPLDFGAYATELAQSFQGQDSPWCFSTACTSAYAALQAACMLMQSGAMDQALIVATELDNQLSASGFHGLGLLSSTRPQPFAATRDGLVLGEAVAALTLDVEPPASTTACWHIMACEIGQDAHSLTGINPDGSVVAEVITRALRNAGLRTHDIDLIKLHAAGAGSTDEAEARALLQVFGHDLSTMPPLLTLKPYIGHTLGASGLAELGLLLDCMTLGRIPGLPASAAQDMPDPHIPLRLGPARNWHPHPKDPTHLLLLGIGFGGSIGALVLGRKAGP